MCKSSALKIFFVWLAISSAACNWRSANETVAPINSEANGEMQTAIPFATREPEIYQTEILITAGGSTRRIFTARNGARRLTVFDPGEENEISKVESGADMTILIARAEKVYAENPQGAPRFAADSGDFLTTEWLNRKTPAAFENLGAENSLTKFRVRLGGAENQNSEALIYVDETLRLPVRQEFYSLKDNGRELNFSVELKNFKPAADEKLFQPPEGYRKISAAELRKIMRREK